MRNLLSAFILLWGLNARANCLPDVAASFAQIDTRNVTPLSLRTGKIFEEGTYVQTIRTRLGIDTHMQGILRIPGTSTFILSGGDKYIKKGSLFIADFKSQRERSGFLRNFVKDLLKDTPEEDRYVSKVDVSENTFWHAGGIGLMENILAVPVEDKKLQASRIVFYDITHPELPQRLDVEISRPESMTGSVLIYRNKNGKIIVAGSVRGKMEFFESVSTDINDGFLPDSRKVETEAAGEGTHIVRQCDGKLFIMDFHNTSKFTPIIWGKNYARLFAFDEDDLSVKLLSKRFFKTQRACNFKAAGSPYVTQDGKLLIYGSSFYRKLGGKRFKLCQFSER